MFVLKIRGLQIWTHVKWPIFGTVEGGQWVNIVYVQSFDIVFSTAHQSCVEAINVRYDKTKTRYSSKEHPR